MNPNDLPPEYVESVHRSQLIALAYWLLCVAFWVWMCYDCYRRRGGLDSWHILFVLCAPSVVLYFILHAREIALGSRSGSSRGLFGFGLGTRIKRAEHQFRVSGTLQSRMELAELYFEANRLPECEQHFEEVIKLDPKNLDALYYVAICRLQRNDNAGALEYLQRVMDGNRKLRFGKAWLRYTDALLVNGRRDDAVEERRKLARNFPRPLTEFAYAQLLADSGQKDKAREMLEEMLSTAVDSPAEDQVWVKKGKSLLGTL